MHDFSKHDHDDYAVEPVPGLPEHLPPGESMLWQGAPAWREVARNVFHVRAVAIYFTALLLARGVWRFNATHDVATSLLSIVALLPFALAGLGLLLLLARAIARTTVYTITDRRLVLRIGVAFPVAINLPFGRIATASYGPGHDGHGDIALTLVEGERIAFSALWPHARPWHLRTPVPMLRAVADGPKIAALLGEAMQAAAAASSLDASLQALPAEAAGTGRSSVVTVHPIGIAVQQT